MFWARKFTQEKSIKLEKIFGLYQVFSHNIFSENLLIPPNHVLSTCTKNIFTTLPSFPTTFPHFLPDSIIYQLYTNFYL